MPSRAWLSRRVTPCPAGRSPLTLSSCTGPAPTPHTGYCHLPPGPHLAPLLLFLYFFSSSGARTGAWFGVILGEQAGSQAGQTDPQAGRGTSSLAADTPLLPSGFTMNHLFLCSFALTSVMAQAKLPRPSPAKDCSLSPATGHRGASGARGANGVHAETLQPGHPLHCAERGAHRYCPGALRHEGSKGGHLHPGPAPSLEMKAGAQSREASYPGSHSKLSRAGTQTPAFCLPGQGSSGCSRLSPGA